jgi:hypothetical protein
VESGSRLPEERAVSDKNDNYVYLLENDPDGSAKAGGPPRIILFSVLSAFLTIACFAWWTDPPEGTRVQPAILVALWLAALLIIGFLCFRVRTTPRDNSVQIGRDFILGPMPGQPRGFTTIRYEDIVSVALDVRKSRISGAIVRAKWWTIVPIRFVQDPAVAVREIFERGPDRVKWRRSGRPFARLSRDDVKTLIEESHPPNINSALPAGAAYACADDLFPKRKDLFARTPTRSANVVSLRPPTAVDRYVGLMLLQMFHAGPTTRILKRSVPLPAVTFGVDTAEPQPFEDVVWNLKTKCGLDPQTAGPLEGTFHLSIQHTPCIVRCRFDSRADACCEIVLEKAQTPCS